MSSFEYPDFVFFFDISFFCVKSGSDLVFKQFLLKSDMYIPILLDSISSGISPFSESSLSES
jgi:hypothetical protein